MSVRAEIKEILLSKTDEDDPNRAERVKNSLLRLADELDAINARLGAPD